MNCLRCGSPMVRVRNERGTAHATCTRCVQYVECARCSRPECGDTKCLACFNKTVSERGRPRALNDAPIVQDEPEIA